MDAHASTSDQEETSSTALQECTSEWRNGWTSHLYYNGSISESSSLYPHHWRMPTVRYYQTDTIRQSSLAISTNLYITTSQDNRLQHTWKRNMLLEMEHTILLPGRWSKRLKVCGTIKKICKYPSSFAINFPHFRSFFDESGWYQISAPFAKQQLKENRAMDRGTPETGTLVTGSINGTRTKTPHHHGA